MKLLLDENPSPQQAAIRSEQGYYAIAVTEAALSGEPDSTITAAGYVLHSSNYYGSSRGGAGPMAGAGRPRHAAGSETKARMRQPHETLPDRTHLSQARTQLRAFAIESGRVLLTLDADFANILQLPPESTSGVIRFKIHPPMEEAIREQIYRTVVVLKDTSLVGCLAVPHGSVMRIRS